MGPLIVLVTLDVGHAIIVFAGLSFLGLGRGATDARMGSDGVGGTRIGRAVVVATFPGLAIFTVVMGFNFLGDGIRDWLDPRARRR